MRRQNIENAAYEVAIQVRAVEDMIDSALSEIAELQARIMRVNSLAGVSYGVIHPTLQQLSTAVTGLVETRGAIVECHAALSDAKGKVPGLRTVSWGDTDDDCPELASTDLRIVA
ncbi:MAG: hypothetical protein H0U34_02825 [Sphingomonas sp.]|nr:hypothetical protein [Sphingomonas sp.]